MFRKVTVLLVAAVAMTMLAALLVWTHERGGHDGQAMVWCVGAGEVVDAKFRAEYPELYMPKASCDAVDQTLNK